VLILAQLCGEEQLMTQDHFRSNDNRALIDNQKSRRIFQLAWSAPLLVASLLWWQSAPPSIAVNMKMPAPPALPIFKQQTQRPQNTPMNATPTAPAFPSAPLAPAFPGQVGKDYNECMRLAGDALKRSSFQSAADNYLEATRLKPTDPAALLGLGHAYIATGHDDEALEQYFGALTLKPDYWPARFAIGQIMMKRESWDEAAQQFMQILHAAPEDSATRGNLAICYEEKGQIDSAIEQFKYIVQVSPKNVEARYNLACAYDLKADFDNAATCYRETIALNQNHSLAYFGLGNCLMNKRDFKSALLVAEAAVKKFPTNYYAYICLGRVYECLQKYDDSKKNYRKAIQLNPKAPECQKLMHNMLKEQADKMGLRGLPGL
jgi:tetratricopeptide (TPR) repeat protein